MFLGKIYNRYRLILSALLMTCAPFGLLAAETRDVATVVVPENTDDFDLYSQTLDVFREPGASLSWDSFLSAPSAYDFVPMTHANFGYTNDAIWIRFKLKYQGSGAHNLKLALSDAIYQNVDVHIYSSATGPRFFRGGVGIAPQERSLKSRMIVFPVSLNEAVESTVYMRIKSRHAMQASMRLLSDAKFAELERSGLMMSGMLTGVIFFLLMFIVFIAAALRNSDFFMYAGFVAQSSLLLLCLNGILDFYFPLGVGRSWGNFLGLFSTSAMFFSLRVQRHFLNLPEVDPRLDLIGNGLAWLVASIGVTWLFSPIAGYSYILDLSLFASILFIISTTSWLVLKKSPRSGTYALSWVPLLLGGCVTIAGRDNLILRTEFTDNALYIGYCVQIVMSALLVAKEIFGIRVQWRAARHDASFAMFKLDEKTRMMRMLVHDLATPVTLLLMTAGRERAKLPESERDGGSWSIVLHAADQLRTVLDLVREMEATTSGKVPMAVTEVNLVDVINEIQFMFQDRLRMKNIKLIVNYPVTDPLMIKGDRRILVFSVFGNIISNAIKFTPEGGRIKIDVASAGKDILEVKVADTGVGVHPTKVNNLFSGTHVTSTLGTSGEKGTGFGLPLVKSFITQMGGDISVSSRWAKDFPMSSGTEFTMKLARAGNRQEAALIDAEV